MSWPQTRHPLRYGPKPARYVSSITLNMIFWTIWLPQDYGSLRRRQWHPTPVLLPGKSHGQRSLVGCSSWGRKESDTTERLQFHFSLLCIGEGNGNPLQCSCLENPRDGGAWWATVCGVAQSRTWLKWLSSSSSMALWEERPWLFPLVHSTGLVYGSQSKSIYWTAVLNSVTFCGISCSVIM